MAQRILCEQQLIDYRAHLMNEEKSQITMQKYLRDVRRFFQFANQTEVTKEMVIIYKQYLVEQNYTPVSINSMLAALNSFLDFMGWQDCKVKNLRTQRKVYCPAEKELSRAEYLRLLAVAKNKPKLNLVLQTICGTGIRVSELKHFTVETLERGEVNVQCKSKIRTVLIPEKLKKKLLKYARQNGITTGPVFVTRTGKPLDRSNIWKQMKSLCDAAGVDPQKVFPHNLRKLFARAFYAMERDIAKLADILGHSSIETTRIYIMTTGVEHRRRIEQLALVT